MGLDAIVFYIVPFILTLVIQIIFCIKLKNIRLKLIPILAPITLILMLLYYRSIRLSSRGTFIGNWHLVLLLIGTIIALVNAIIIGWMAYSMYIFIIRNREE